MGKEVIEISGETLMEFDLYREGDFFEYEGQRYDYVAQHRVDGDGEWTRIVAKRESDGKLFAYDWGYGDTKNYYEDDMTEVKPVNKVEYE